MVTTGTNNAVVTGGMDDAWRGWMRIPNDQKTRVCWKKIWGRAFLEKSELVRLMGIAYNGMANQAAEIQMLNTMIVALDNLTNVTVQKNDTVERLFISVSSIYASLAARDTEIAWLLTFITNLSMGRGNDGGNNVKAAISPWDLMGYCCQNGLKVCVGHCSDLCEKCKDGNDLQITENRGDIQGGCKKNKN